MWLVLCILKILEYKKEKDLHLKFLVQNVNTNRIQSFLHTCTHKIQKQHTHTHIFPATIAPTAQTITINH